MSLLNQDNTNYQDLEAIAGLMWKDLSTARISQLLTPAYALSRHVAQRTSSIFVRDYLRGKGFNV